MELCTRERERESERYSQKTLTIGGRMTLRLVSSLNDLCLTQQENM